MTNTNLMDFCSEKNTNMYSILMSQVLYPTN